MREPGGLRGCAVRQRTGHRGALRGARVAGCLCCGVPVLRVARVASRPCCGLSGSGAAVISEFLQVSGVIRVDFPGSDLSFHVTSAAITGLGWLTGAA